MSTKLPKQVLESADITAIIQLILRERKAGTWGGGTPCGLASGRIRSCASAGFAAMDRILSVDRSTWLSVGLLPSHRLGPILVRLNQERAVDSLTGAIDLPLELAGVQATLSTHARFLYRAERRTAEWRLFGFDVVYSRDELTPAIAGETIAIDPSEVKGFRSSYRLLGYHLKTLGFSIDSGLAGEDRPDLVDALHEELFAWAGLPIAS